jgi:hypothetical protein
MLGPVRGPLVVENAAHQQGIRAGEAGVNRGPISSSKYGTCHLSGDSTTPSREIKTYDLILRTSEPPDLRVSVV